MKLRLVWASVVFASLTVAALGGPRDAEWQRVKAARDKGLPKTAIEELKPIITAATADRAYPEAIKAIAEKIALEDHANDDAGARIAALQVEVEKAPPPMKPAMETILAHWYWQYFQLNRWRFARRTPTSEAPSADIATWDLQRILAEIDRHFTAALADEATLKATPIAAYDDLLIRGKFDDEFRPTLFDFLAHEALRFYQTGEQGGSVAEDEFEVDAESPIFADAPELIKWPLPAADRSPKQKAIHLYQALLAFHQSDTNRAAFYDVDLARLVYGHNVAVGEDKDDRYKAALQRLIDASGKISARPLAALAAQLKAEGDFLKAHETAQRGTEGFRESAGPAMCVNLMHDIEAKSARIDTEHVWNAPWPTVNITYRNITKIHFRAVHVGFERYLAQKKWNFFGAGESEIDEFLDGVSAFNWDHDLPATDDYKDRTEQLPVPTSLQPGFYVVLASPDAQFRRFDNQVSVATIWVSNLALLLRNGETATDDGGFVLKAESGEPVANANVRIWHRDREGSFVEEAAAKTDADGRFQLPPAQGPRVVLAEFGGQATAATSEVYSSQSGPKSDRNTETVFFTDRALYRPGQTIYYKGISIAANPGSGEYEAQAGHEITVVFYDPNGHEIARANHRTNDYGSFNGVFTAPRDRLAGQMRIQAQGETGTAVFNVEAYKRPKFQVQLKAPTEAAKLGTTIELAGEAKAYTGSSIGGAQVKWRVERRAQLPYWCWWIPAPISKPIAHGIATTQPDGSFRIAFTAAPDRAIPPKNEPIFAFVVHADITDSTGETRSDEHTVKAGYTALQASLMAEDWQTPDKPVELSIRTHSLDDAAQPATGTVTIYALKQPATVQRAPLEYDLFQWVRGADEPKPDATKPESWELENVVVQKSFATDTDGDAKIAVTLSPGIYRAALETTDRLGQKVTARQTVQVISPRATRYAVKISHRLAAARWSAEPGETFTACWGTGYDTGRAFVEFECNGKLFRSFWTAADRTQQLLEQSVSEQMRGGFTVRVTYVRENRAYVDQHVVDVPWTNKQLTVKWESFRSKLTPGQKETWTAVVAGPHATRAAAEMVATLYDASLDQYLPQRWPSAFNVLRREHFRLRSQFENGKAGFQNVAHWLSPVHHAVAGYRQFDPEIMSYGFDRGDDVIMLSPFSVSTGGTGTVMHYFAADSLAGTRVSGNLGEAALRVKTTGQATATEVNDLGYSQGTDGAPPIDLGKVGVRKNLNETAFFFPTLLAGDDGQVKIVFTVPEALTQWKFLGFAHDEQLRSGFLTDTAVTAKSLMVEPNAPRFLREGDTIEFTVKVTNQSDQAQSGAVRLTLADAESLAGVDDALQNRNPQQTFKLGPKESRSYSWRIVVPDGIGFLTYKAVAASNKYSDGEEGSLPVLSRRTLVTESLPLPIRGPATKQFDFKKLLDSAASGTLRHESLTVQMVSQPAWYAVMALPYLMEYPYECSEQMFNRFYADALARHIANSDPKIRRIFDRWKNTPALDSPLEKNETLKSVTLEETPWRRQAKKESEARRNVGVLFDANRLDAEAARTLQTLSERQLSGGLWSWFPGGRPSEYISLYIATGFGRLRHAGVTVDVQPALKCLDELDRWIDDEYQRLKTSSSDPSLYVPSYTDALYLYGRSFFLSDRPIGEPHREAVDFLLRQARRLWLKVDSNQSQAHLAIALQRFDDRDTAQAIMRSLKERSVHDAELGMYWSNRGSGWWWYQAPIETQATLIEAFAEVANDAAAVEDCKVWLLKQKQTQAWHTTKATADAIYALLLRGQNLLASDARVEVSLGGEKIRPDKVEAGTGFYEQRFVRDQIKPAMGHVTVRKTDAGVSWGSVHWQYLEDIAKITPHEETPLKLKKTLFVNETTATGQILKPVNGPVSVGDELVVRIELRTDRDMEFVHLKDQRGSGTEPVNVLSRYKYQDGLGYYESTRDTATHFFIEYLRKGTYVFEYSTRVQLKGRYETGLAEIQCMYAPEFNSHSESIALEVK